jgi:hypothetical protein
VEGYRQRTGRPREVESTGDRDGRLWMIWESGFVYVKTEEKFLSCDRSWFGWIFLWWRCFSGGRSRGGTTLNDLRVGIVFVRREYKFLCLFALYKRVLSLLNWFDLVWFNQFYILKSKLNWTEYFLSFLIGLFGFFYLVFSIKFFSGFLDLISYSILFLNPTKNNVKIFFLDNIIVISYLLMI